MKFITYFKNSLISKFILCLIIFMIIPFLSLLWITDNEVKKNENQRAEDAIIGSLNVIALTMDNRLSSIDPIFSNLLLDPDFTNNVTNLEPYSQNQSYQDFLCVRSIKNSLTETSTRNNDIGNIYLYTPNKKRVFVSNISWNQNYNVCDLSDSEWYHAFLKSFTEKSWVITDSLENEDKILTSYRTIGKLNSSISGIFSINITENKVRSILEESNPYNAGFCYMIDNDNNLLSTPVSNTNILEESMKIISTDGSNGFLSVDLGQTPYYLSYYHSQESRFTFVLGVPKSELKSNVSSINNLILWYILNTIIVIIIYIAISYLLLLKPIRSLSHGMKVSQRGNFEIRLSESRTDEIGEINHRFNCMNQNIDQLIKENYLVKLKKYETELRVLSNQINEHFLYNTLDSINWLAKRNKDTQVSNVILSLSSFYRISLSGGENKITISKLNELINNYLHIQKLRMGDDLQFEIEIEPEIENIYVPKHLFIPILENSIIHGLRGIENGLILVSIKKINNNIRFSVTDNGRGISQDRLSEIRRILNNPNSDGDNCFALKNINEQLLLYLKNNDGVKLESTEGFGTKVWFDIPIKENNKQA